MFAIYLKEESLENIICALIITVVAGAIQC